MRILSVLGDQFRVYSVLLDVTVLHVKDEVGVLCQVSEPTTGEGRY